MLNSLSNDKTQKTYNDAQQANFIKLVLSLIEIQNEQLHLATTFFLKAKGYNLIDNALNKYIIDTYALNTKLIQLSMVINQKQMDVNTIYELTTTYTNDYYNNVNKLKHISEMCENSNIRVENQFIKLYMDINSHSNIDFNIPNAVYDIKKYLQPLINAPTRKASRITKFNQ